MPQINNFPGGFASGLTVRGQPIAVTHPGKVFWVSNASTLSDRQIGGSNSGPGTFDKPFSTINGAQLACVANRGDIIFVKPGHVEAVTTTAANSASLSLTVAGVAVIGLGQGSVRPKLTFGATTSQVLVAANNVTISNFLHTTSAVVVAAYAVANAQVATDFTIDNCEFRDTDATHNFVIVFSAGTTANIVDGFAFTNNKVYLLATAGVVVVLKFASIVDRAVITGNTVMATGIAAQPVFIQLGTSLNHTNLYVADNVVFNPTTDSTNGAIVGGSGTMTGLFVRNLYGILDNTAGIWIPTGLGLSYLQNFAQITGAADKSALINPAAV